MDSSGSGLYTNLRKIIGIIDQLRDIGLQKYISLPRIAVLGTQSSGKSSLLEMIVGIDFLPRGEGVVTRRPLELRLVHTPGLKEPYGMFEQVKGAKFTDFNKVREKINQLTDEVAGKNKGIIDDPIILTVYAESCPDLTVIDLPGITRIPLANSDQPKDIEKITKDMALRYVMDPRTIILCVVPANADISTSDALQIAREIDPRGQRTIGVITKIDIMDRGTNAKSMLLGQDIPLRLGYVGVKGRSNQDIKDGISVKKGLDDERKFFASHPVYSTMQQGYTGTDALVQKLTQVLYTHIRTYLPDIYKEIVAKMSECEDRLKDLGTALPKDSGEKLHLLWQMTTSFCENFKNQIRGKYDMKHYQVKTELSGAAKIRSMFNEVYEDYTPGNRYRATSSYTDRDIQKAILLHEGDSIPGFPSIDAFLALLQPQLDRLKEPALDLVNTVYAYLEEVAIGLIGKLFYRFPMLIGEFQEMVCKYMQVERDSCRAIVESIVDAEQGYLFTNDMDYITNRTNVVPKENTQTFDPEKILIMELRNRIDSYFAIVLRNVRDSVPKAVGHFLVRATQDNLQFSLYNHINKSKTLMDLLSEPQNVAVERETLQKTLDVLGKAARLLKKDPDFASAFGSAVREKEEEEERKETKPQKKAEPQQPVTNGAGFHQKTPSDSNVSTKDTSFTDFSNFKTNPNPQQTQPNQGGGGVFGNQGTAQQKPAGGGGGLFGNVVGGNTQPNPSNPGTATGIFPTGTQPQPKQQPPQGNSLFGNTIPPVKKDNVPTGNAPTGGSNNPFGPKK
mmetsp:Transcript_35812/g.41776  ORF Transcript_35812/g.41776 Transcript_35812/m.41776 type:complete len:789 (+) Transcript_35812:42-2408(+)